MPPLASGRNIAIPVGATVALTGLFAGPINGASMNPARKRPACLIAQDEHAGEISGGSSFLSVGDSSFWRRS